MATPGPLRVHQKLPDDELGFDDTRILHSETGNTVARMGDPSLDDSCPPEINAIDAAILAHAFNKLPIAEAALERAASVTRAAKEEAAVFWDNNEEWMEDDPHYCALRDDLTVLELALHEIRTVEIPE